MNNNRFRMPTVFGPTCGPRSGPSGIRYDYSKTPRRVASVSFLTDEKHLARLLPPKFSLLGEPVVTIEWSELTHLEWLAGRGYNMLGVKYNAQFTGSQDVARGPFLSVLWENRPEPIISGREELGFAKLYCQLPEPRCHNGSLQISASWDGHIFLNMQLNDLQDKTPPTPASTPDTGTLHHRYFPKVSVPGEADIEQAVITPAGGHDICYPVYQVGQGSAHFIESLWEQIPTMYQVVNALAALPILENRGAVYFESIGAKDLSDQRILR